MDIANWLPRRFRRMGGLLVLAILFVLMPLSNAAGADDWKFDVLRLKNGGVFKGLLLEENDSTIRFRIVRRNSGEATSVTTTATFQRGELESIQKLDAKERKILEERLKALDPEGKGEKLRMESLELKVSPWVKGDGSEALSYEAAHFALVSNAKEDIVRRAAVRLEDIYAAYARYLPPRSKSVKPTPIILVRSMAEYRALLKDQGRDILNPAFYDPTRNQVVCASDLEKLGEELERVRTKHKGILDQLKAQELALRKQFGRNIPATYMKRINGLRLEIVQANKKNDGIFDEATKQLFQTLYHEAFHAYLANFVYRAEEAEVPRWLNEGLAQIYETAIIEAGELRVGHVEKNRLKDIKTAAQKGTLIPLAGILKSGAKQFLLSHLSDKQGSDRHYLNSWALASYLTFDRGLLGTAAMHRYVGSLKRGTDELEAFRELAGKPLAEFEKEYQQYLLNLKPDGTSSKSPTVKKP